MTTAKENQVFIFDTTLRDGEQSPGFSMNTDEKLRVALQLEKLGVDIIEAGFPIASQGDFDAVRTLASSLKKSVVAGLGRTAIEDVEKCIQALEHAAKPRIHTFISSSDIHLKHQLKKSRKTVLKEACRAVELAKTFTDDVEFSAMDATRSDWDYLVDLFTASIECGATTINIPDTVGYAIPQEFRKLVAYIRDNVKGIENVVISVHCHNDLGLAVANSLAALEEGARQVECAVNGIGERAGNTALEEIVMAIKVREDLLKFFTKINPKQIYPTSRLITSITGITVQPNKAIVGANAFAHESGIHQDGVLKKKITYEIMKPESIGVSKTSLVLGKHSGRHAFRDRIESLGYDLDDEQINLAFQSFKNVADKKKDVYDEDLEAIIAEEILRLPDTPDKYKFVYLVVTSGSEAIPSATVSIEIDGAVQKMAGQGDGPVDAVMKTIAKITKTKSKFLNYAVSSITGGTDALGEVSITLEEGDAVVIGQGAHPDVIVASAKAYVNALNKLELRKKHPKKVRMETPIE